MEEKQFVTDICSCVVCYASCRPFRFLTKLSIVIEQTPLNVVNCFLDVLIQKPGSIQCMYVHFIIVNENSDVRLKRQ